MQIKSFVMPLLMICIRLLILSRARTFQVLFYFSRAPFGYTFVYTWFVQEFVYALLRTQVWFVVKLLEVPYW